MLFNEQINPPMAKWGREEEVDTTPNRFFQFFLGMGRACVAS